MRRSNYEVAQKFALPYRQQASDIGIFPVIPLDPLRHASFWPVEAVPASKLVAGGMVTIPAQSMVDGIYYYDESTKQVFARGVPSTGGTGPILANMALQSINGPIKVGSVLPNIARYWSHHFCICVLHGDWLCRLTVTLQGILTKLPFGLGLT